MNELNITANRLTHNGVPLITISHGDFTVSIMGMAQLKRLISTLDDARIYLERPEFQRTVSLR